MVVWTYSASSGKPQLISFVLHQNLWLCFSVNFCVSVLYVFSDFTDWRENSCEYEMISWYLTGGWAA